MPVVNSEAPGSSSNATPPAESAKATNGTEYATKAELEAFQKTIADSLQAQSGLLGGLRNDIKGIAKVPKTDATKTEDATLTARIKALEDSETRQRDNLRFGSLKSAAMAKGVPEKKADLFAKMILAEHGKETVVVTDDYRVLFKESDDKQVPVTDWASAYLQTEAGEIFLPPKAAGSSDGQAGNGKTSTAHPFASLTFEQIQEQRAKNPAAYYAYVNEHSAEYDAKAQRYKP